MASALGFVEPRRRDLWFDTGKCTPQPTAAAAGPPQRGLKRVHPHRR